MVQKGADYNDLVVCVLYGCIVESFGFPLVRARRVLLPEVGFETLFAVAEQEMLPLTVERLAELHWHVRDEDEDASIDDRLAYFKTSLGFKCSAFPLDLFSWILYYDSNPCYGKQADVEAEEDSEKYNNFLFLEDGLVAQLTHHAANLDYCRKEQHCWREVHHNTHAMYPIWCIFAIPDANEVEQAKEGVDEDDRGEKPIKRPDCNKIFSWV